MQNAIALARQSVDAHELDQALSQLDAVFRGSSVSRRDAREVYALLDLIPIDNLSRNQREHLERLRRAAGDASGRSKLVRRRAERAAQEEATRRQEARERVAREEAARRRKAREVAAAEAAEAMARAAVNRRVHELLHEGMPAPEARAIALGLPEGPYEVALTGVRDRAGELPASSLLNVQLQEELRFERSDATSVIDRAIHIAPEVLVSGVAQDDAIKLKVHLEATGARVVIRSAAPRSPRMRRQAIPQHVRLEVWQRDGGRCVECGSNERLEYDHIIAVVNGGANTARNIELRCENCNRKKGASI